MSGRNSDDDDAMAHVPLRETIPEIIDERIEAWGLRPARGDGRWQLANRITDRTGVRFTYQNLTNWIAGQRPTDESMKRFANGTAGPPYRGRDDLPGLTSEHMLERLRRARSGVTVEVGPELTQSWQNLPADIRRDLNPLMDRIAAALERAFRDGYAAGYAAAGGTGPDTDPPTNDNNGPRLGPSGAAQA